ncbi:MAG: InlB B-repeat-containing protein [Firmicutes bacterium]|nr:InlB B-repeat-containing protein [Bacillota bacterium]
MKKILSRRLKSKVLILSLALVVSMTVAFALTASSCENDTQFSVTFNLNHEGASAPFTFATNENGNGRLPIAPNTPTRTGFEFVGWSTSAADPLSLIDPAVHEFTADTVLFAHWEAIIIPEYFISRNWNFAGAPTLTAVQTQNGGHLTQADLPSTIINREGYVFRGWWTGQNGQSLVNNWTPEFEFTQTTTLFAFWTPTEARNFTVSFDFNFVDAPQNPASVPTVDGHITGVPEVPQREGFNFEGWWLSFDKGATFYRRWFVSTPFNQNTTLYARYSPVWSGAASRLSSPLISVDNTGITWDAIPQEQIIQNPQGFTFNVEGPTGFTNIVNRAFSTSVTRFIPINFSTQPQGTYTITAIVRAGVEANNSLPTTVTFINRQLAAVPTPFTVLRDGGYNVLSFDPISDAPNNTRYDVLVECADFLERSFPLTGTQLQSLTFNFADLNMPEDGFIFRVRASASGHVASYSDHWTFLRELDQVNINSISVNPTTQELTWDAPDFATNYRLKITSGDYVYFENNPLTNPVTTRRFDLRSVPPHADGVRIEITPLAANFASPQPTVFVWQKATLAAPSNLSVWRGDVEWDPVAGAIAYEVSFGVLHGTMTVHTVPAPNNFWTITELSDTATYVVSVRAITAPDAIFTSSLWSTPMEVRNFLAPLSYGQNHVSWQAVAMADKYYVSLNGETLGYADDSTRFEITFDRAGTHAIQVWALDEEGTELGRQEIIMQAFTVFFETPHSHPDFPAQVQPNQFYANGDHVRFPTPIRPGHEFAGWYSLPSDQEGAILFSNVNPFIVRGNSTLFSAWRTSLYDAELRVGENRALPVNAQGADITTVRVRFANDFSIPVPTNQIFDGRVFLGWYTQENGGGTRLTNQFGRSLNPWAIYNTGENFGLYAYFAEVFTFTLRAGTSTDQWQIERHLDEHGNSSAAFRLLEEIIIPSRFDGFVQQIVVEEGDDEDVTAPALIIRPVSALVTRIGPNGFIDAPLLERFLIPNSINDIPPGVFFNTPRMREFVVYQVQGVLDPVLSSDSGYLLRNLASITDPADRFSIIAIPQSMSGHFIIPDSVNQIGQGLFQHMTGITGVTIGRNVSIIEAEAFDNTPNLGFVTFAAPLQGAPVVPLMIGTNAFRRAGANISFENAGELRIPTRVFSLDSGSLYTDALANAAFGGAAFFRSLVFETGGTDQLGIRGTGSNTVAANGVFGGNPNLRSVFISNRISLIGHNAFMGSPITTFEFERSNSLPSRNSSGAIVNNPQAPVGPDIPLRIGSGSLSAAEGGAAIERILFRHATHRYLGAMTLNRLLMRPVSGHSVFPASIESIVIPARTTLIDDGAFLGFPGSRISFECVWDGERGPNFTPVVAGTMPLEIGSYAFAATGGFAEFVVPARVTRIGMLAFGTSGLNTLRFELGGTAALNIDDMAFAGMGVRGDVSLVYSTNQTINPLWQGSLMLFMRNNPLAAPASVNTRPSLTHVIDIPNRTTRIGEWAFHLGIDTSRDSRSADGTRVGSNNHVLSVSFEQGGSQPLVLAEGAFAEFRGTEIILPARVSAIHPLAFVDSVLSTRGTVHPSSGVTVTPVNWRRMTHISLQGEAGADGRVVGQYFSSYDGVLYSADGRILMMLSAYRTSINVHPLAQSIARIVHQPPSALVYLGPHADIVRIRNGQSPLSGNARITSDTLEVLYQPIYVIDLNSLGLTLLAT